MDYAVNVNIQKLDSLALVTMLLKRNNSTSMI